jgi:hypothetical protein
MQFDAGVAESNRLEAFEHERTMRPLHSGGGRRSPRR